MKNQRVGGVSITTGKQEKVECRNSTRLNLRLPKGDEEPDVIFRCKGLNFMFKVDKITKYNNGNMFMEIRL